MRCFLTFWHQFLHSFTRTSRVISPLMSTTSPFLRLPLEIRNHIYSELFFPTSSTTVHASSLADFEARKLRWASERLANTAPNQIHPYRVNTRCQPRFDLCAFRVNRQIHVEAATVFYGWSSFNLTTDAFGPSDFQSYQFLEKLQKKYRRLIRRIECRCFDEYRQLGVGALGTRRSLPLADWKFFMRFLAQECPSLQSLRLWGYADPEEGASLAASCRLNEDWVMALVEIKTLCFFDIPAIPRGAVMYRQLCVPGFVQRL